MKREEDDFAAWRSRKENQASPFPYVYPDMPPQFRRYHRFTRTLFLLEWVSLLTLIAGLLLEGIVILFRGIGKPMGDREALAAGGSSSQYRAVPLIGIRKDFDVKFAQKEKEEICMIRLDSPIWKKLSSAGNDADRWLRELVEGNGELRENIEVVAEDLSHQLSWYSATSYALPHLAALCSRLSKEDKVYLIAQLGAAIAAEAVEPLEPDTEAYREFHEGLEGLRRETVPLLTDPEVHTKLCGEAELGTMFALGALAVVGDRKHAYDLWYLSGSTWEEGPAACVCGWEDETVSLAEPLEFLEPAEIGLWDRHSLEDEAVWLYGLLSLIGDEMMPPFFPLCTAPGPARSAESKNPGGHGWTGLWKSAERGL